MEPFDWLESEPTIATAASNVNDAGKQERYWPQTLFLSDR